MPDERSRSAALMTALFLLANMLGFLAALNLRAAPAVQEAAAAYQSPTAGLQVFLIIAVATALLLALYRFDIGIAVRVWFGIAIFLTTLLFFDAMVPPVPAVLLTALVVAARFRIDDPLFRNLADTLAFAGAGAVFGSLLSASAAAVLFALLAVYDVVAVNYSGHMITLAREGAASDTFMGFTAPRQDGADLADLADADAERLADAPEGEAAAGGVSVLGGGDVIVPMIFALSLMSTFGPAAAIFTMLGAAAALHLFFVRLSGEKFYPAIPVVGAGSLAGLAAWLLLSLLI